jgi:hypothetical protein
MSATIVLLAVVSTYALALAGAGWVQSIIDSRRITRRLNELNRRDQR